jgi:hypothetical protein
VSRTPPHVTGFEEVLELFVEDATAWNPDVLVAHSNAGHYAPSVAAACNASRILFLDAALPAEAGGGRMVPDRFASFLSGIANEDGTLPKWTRWWPRADIEGLFPDAGWFDLVDAGCPTAHISYFDLGPEPPERWFEGHHSYVAFGDTYQEELERARSHGWSTRVMEGRHLYHLVNPGAVAGAVVRAMG